MASVSASIFSSMDFMLAFISASMAFRSSMSLIFSSGPIK
jgi:hypothetical protein